MQAWRADVIFSLQQASVNCPGGRWPDGAASGPFFTTSYTPTPLPWLDWRQILPVRLGFDIVDHNLRPLEVGRALRRAKQLGVVIQCVEDFEGSNASPGEETRLAGKKILAAIYVKVGTVGTGNGLWTCRDWQKQKCN
jgi:hypothetical protein